MHSAHIRDRSLQALEWSIIQEALAARTRSPLGSTLASQHTPFSTKAQSERLRMRVSEARALLPHSMVHSYLADVHSPQEFFERASRDGTLTPSEVFICGHFIESVSSVAKEIKNNVAIAPLWAEDFQPAPKVPAICERIKRSVTPVGAILDTASEKLARLRSQRTDRRTSFESLLDVKIKDWHSQGLLQDKFYDVLDGRYVVPVKIEQQSKVDGILLGKSNTGQSAFIEPMELTAPNNELKALEIAVRAEEFRILRELSQQIGALAPQYTPWIEVLAELDLAFAAAILANEWTLSAPLITQALNLRDAFHPGLKLQNIDIITNTFELLQDGQGLIISGPNTGGKTVLLKAAGLSANMARAGLFIPARPQSQVPHYAEVIAFIGDEQNLAQGLSSFSAQIRDLNAVLEDRASGQKLIVIDEMLSSTDPEEASALAQAMIEEFIALGHHVIITTHFSELSIRSKVNKKVTVAAMEFDEGHPTYRLRLDELGSSHALEVADRLGLPKKILARAKTLLSTAKLDYDKAQAELKEKESVLIREHQQALKKFEEEKDTLKRVYDLKVKSLQERLDEFLSNAHASLNETVAKLGQRVVNYARLGIGKNAEEKLKFSAKESLAKIEQASEEAFSDILQPSTETPDVFEVGRSVRVKSLGSSLGTIVELKKTSALIQAGNFRLEKSLDDLELLPKEKQRPQKRFFSTEEMLPVNPKLDLRGIRYEEAMSQVEHYLDHAFRNGAAIVTVITGHGTGALKQGLKELLAQLPYIKEYKPERAHDDGAFQIEFER